MVALVAAATLDDLQQEADYLAALLHIPVGVAEAQGLASIDLYELQETRQWEWGVRDGRGGWGWMSRVGRISGGVQFAHHPPGRASSSQCLHHG